MMASKYPEMFGNCIAMMVYSMHIKLLEAQLKEQPKDPTRYVLVTGSKDERGVKENTEIEKLLKDKNFPVISTIIEGGAHPVDSSRSNFRLAWKQFSGRKSSYDSHFSLWQECCSE